MRSFKDRILGAARLEVAVYEEVEADEGALGQALGVVLISSLAAGLGGMQRAGWTGLLAGALSALLGWYVWAYVTYFIGVKMLPESQTSATHGQLLRTLGFANAPGILRIVGIIPGLFTIASLVAGIWMLITTVVAVRQALDYTSTLRAVGVCIIGWLIYSLLAAVTFFIFGNPLA